jgi:putative SOS response-associated peptidase YedK
MCGRYLTPDEAALERAWQVRAPTGYRQSYNFAPSQLAPVLLAGKGSGLELGQMVWGFQPSWAKRAWINARSETVFSSRAFAPAAKRHRCLVPAIGWYEWQGAKAPRQPWLFHLDGFTPFAFAGIFTPPGATENGNFAILTAEASAPLAGIHHRMPVVLTRDDQSRWLDPGLDVEAAGHVLERHVPDFCCYKVSSHVNKPAHNDAACITPV